VHLKALTWSIRASTSAKTIPEPVVLQRDRPIPHPSRTTAAAANLVNGFFMITLHLLSGGAGRFSVAFCRARSTSANIRSSPSERMRSSAVLNNRLISSAGLIVLPCHRATLAVSPRRTGSGLSRCWVTHSGERQSAAAACPSRYGSTPLPAARRATASMPR